METLTFIDPFQQFGTILMGVLLILSCLTGITGAINIFSRKPIGANLSYGLLWGIVFCFLVGFVAICWLHYMIYMDLPLILSDSTANWLNGQLQMMNAQSSYSMPLYDLNNPPRYMIPMWIENEKYFFWFLCYAVMTLLIWRRPVGHRLQGMLLVLLTLQVIILANVADPFREPLPRFFAEITPWFSQNMAPMQQFGAFMKLYPRMIFYYNASYMWLHPPMLFVSYACITGTFVTSVFMLSKREIAIEHLGYDCAKFGYFMLTLGMLLGYPWALKAWGPNWWWDPKICSSLMMWAVYSTYLHTRLYANKAAMWYFTSILGIVCFIAMIFTFITSFYFPGEHTFQ